MNLELDLELDLELRLLSNSSASSKASKPARLLLLVLVAIKSPPVLAVVVVGVPFVGEVWVFVIVCTNLETDVGIGFRLPFVKVRKEGGGGGVNGTGEPKSPGCTVGWMLQSKIVLYTVRPTFGGGCEGQLALSRSRARLAEVELASMVSVGPFGTFPMVANSTSDPIPEGGSVNDGGLGNPAKIFFRTVAVGGVDGTEL